MLGEVGDAEDVVQEAFLRAYRAMREGNVRAVSATSAASGGTPAARAAYRVATSRQLSSRGRGPLRRRRVRTALRRGLERVLRAECRAGAAPAEAAEFLARRLRQLANERDKLLRAYYADAIDGDPQARAGPHQRRGGGGRVTACHRRREARAGEADHRPRARSRLGCAASHRKAKHEIRTMWNCVFFRTIRVRDGAIAAFTYEEPSRPSSVNTRARWWTWRDATRTCDCRRGACSVSFFAEASLCSPTL